MEKKKGFQKHESSDSHMEAVARYVTAPATVIGDIGDLLSERHALEKSKNKKIFFVTILSNNPILSTTGFAIKKRLEH